MREAPDSAILLGSLAGVFVAASVVGLLMLARQRGGLGRASVAGASACGIGLGLLVAAGVVSRLNSDFSGMPALVVPGVLCLVVGFLLIAWALFRSGVVPKWLAACVVACALLLLVANEQTSRILLAVPFGLAWMLLGIVVLTQASASNRTKSSSS